MQPLRREPSSPRSEIRELHERLEYSELQNLNLSRELKRLGKELQDAKFRERSTILPPSVPMLPNEILRHIFKFAVHLDGLVSPFWNGCSPYMPWLVSSGARYNIPMVCRQWYTAGIQYLYDHIVLSHPARVDALLEHLESLKQQPAIYEERLHWIRGIEFVMYMLEPLELEVVATKACKLIDDLPNNRLRAFGLEHGYCGGQHEEMKVASLVATGIAKGHRSLEALHVPCMRPEAVIFSHELFSPTKDSDDLNCEGLPRLDNLSLTSGWWESCSGKGRLNHPIIPFLTQNNHSIHSLSLNLSVVDTSAGVLLRFLRAAVQLESLAVIVGPSTRLLREDLDLLLESVPNLRRLSIGASNRHNRTVPPVVAGQHCHSKLEEITLIMESASNFDAMLVLQPLLGQILAGNFPALTHIILRGAFPDGCLDGKDIFTQEHRERWVDVIEGCCNRGVYLVNEVRDPIHLWHAQHAIKLDESDGESRASSSPSGGSSYWTMSSSEYSNATDSIHGTVSDDSEDCPYQYSSRPDLDFDSDSDEIGSVSPDLSLNIPT